MILHLWLVPCQMTSLWARRAEFWSSSPMWQTLGYSFIPRGREEELSSTGGIEQNQLWRKTRLGWGETASIPVAPCGHRQ